MSKQLARGLCAFSIAVCLATLVYLSPLRAQIGNSPPTDLSAQIAAAVSGALPSDCPAPSADTLSGSAGTSTHCLPHPDATRPTAVQAANTTLNADCTWSVTFSRAFSNTTPIIHAIPVLSAGATQPMPCFISSRSTTTQSGKCYPGKATLLNLSLITSGLTLSPFDTTCTAGTPLMIVGREATQ